MDGKTALAYNLLNSTIELYFRQETDMNNKPLVVMKFGGAALKNQWSIDKSTDQIREYFLTNYLVIIVSALSGVTDKLYTLCSLCKKGETSSCIKLITQISANHTNILSQMGSSIEIFETQQQIQYLIDLLRIFIMKHLTEKLTQAQVDYVVSFGERLSIHIVSFVLKQKHVKVIAVDSSYLLKTTKEFGNAKIYQAYNKETIKKICEQAIASNIIPVITGFIGQGTDGCIRTLGRGGSDYSATSIAALIKADRVILWKDVHGMYDKDPKKYSDAKYFYKVNYDKALEMSKHGAKILHPESILPAKANKIPVLIKSFLKPTIPGTEIWKGETIYA